MDNYDKALVAEFLEENYERFKQFLITREFDGAYGKEDAAEDLADEIINQLQGN